MEARPDPEFLTWLVSSPDPDDLGEEAPTNSAGSVAEVELVGEGTVGSSTEGRVTVPMLPMENKSGNMAWWVGDQGLKAMLALPGQDEPNDMAGVRGQLQASPNNAVDLADGGGGNQPFAGIDLTDERLGALTDWTQTAFFADSPQGPQPLFHDLVTRSSGLLTNVRQGGFRKDLSMALQRGPDQAPDSTQTALYKVNGERGINLQELWAYYNLVVNGANGGRKTCPLQASLSGGSITQRSDANYLSLQVGNLEPMVFKPGEGHQVLPER